MRRLACLSRVWDGDVWLAMVNGLVRQPSVRVQLGRRIVAAHWGVRSVGGTIYLTDVPKASSQNNVLTHLSRPSRHHVRASTGSFRCSTRLVSGSSVLCRRSWFVAPYREQHTRELAGERDGGDALAPPDGDAVGPFLQRLRFSALRPEQRLRRLDEQRAHATVACLGDVAASLDFSGAHLPRHEAEIRAHLACGGEALHCVHHGHERACSHGADTRHGHEALGDLVILHAVRQAALGLCDLLVDYLHHDDERREFVLHRLG